MTTRKTLGPVLYISKSCNMNFFFKILLCICRMFTAVNLSNRELFMLTFLIHVLEALMFLFNTTPTPRNGKIMKILVCSQALFLCSFLKFHYWKTNLTIFDIKGHFPRPIKFRFLKLTWKYFWALEDARMKAYIRFFFSN